MKIIPLAVGDRLNMKKNHPCGSDTMEVLRIGSDIRIRCVGCGRDLTLPRIRLEKYIRQVLPKDSAANPPDNEKK
ncbi:MAG: DUF951 domain-containing protein [Eubacteriales bacterium]